MPSLCRDRRVCSVLSILRGWPEHLSALAPLTAARSLKEAYHEFSIDSVKYGLSRDVARLDAFGTVHALLVGRRLQMATKRKARKTKRRDWSAAGASALTARCDAAGRRAHPAL